MRSRADIGRRMGHGGDRDLGAGVAAQADRLRAVLIGGRGSAAPQSSTFGLWSILTSNEPRSPQCGFYHRPPLATIGDREFSSAPASVQESAVCRPNNF
jgi:hypothetical protein